MEYKSYTALIFSANIKKNFLKLPHNSGASLIATVLVLLIFALFIAIAVSLVTTGSNISLQEEQGTQSLFIADGGLEFSAVFNFPNHDGWPTPVIDKPLGAGTFTLTVPTLSANINNTVTDINVSSTDGFQAAPDGEHWIMMCDTVGNARPNVTASSTCEKISFPDTSFTGGTRGRHSSVPAQHLQNAVVIMYLWDTNITTRLSRTANLNAPRICVNSTTGFTIPGLIQIEDAEDGDNQFEDVWCTAIGTPATCSTPPQPCAGDCFTGCTRNAYNGNASGYTHDIGNNLYQSEISALTTSTGIINNALAGSITRKIQAGLEPLQ